MRAVNTARTSCKLRASCRLHAQLPARCEAWQSLALPGVYIYVHLAYGWAKRDILSACHVFEQSVALEDKTDFPLLCGNPGGILVCTAAAS